MAGQSDSWPQVTALDHKFREALTPPPSGEGLDEAQKLRQAD